MSNFYTASQSRFRMSQASSAFITQLSSGSRGRELVTSIALAMAVCEMSALPAGEVQDPQTHFLTQAGVCGAEAVGIINELVPVDYAIALDIAKGLYLARYELAVKPFAAFGYKLSDGVPSLLGLKNHLPDNVIACMQSNGSEIADKFRRFKEVIGELKKA